MILERRAATPPGIALLTLVLISILSVDLASQGRATVWDGVYNSAQAQRGQGVYDEHCAACHLDNLRGSAEARPLVGQPFMLDWREDTLHNLFTRVRTLMPFDDPATLRDEAYLEALVYILQVNGFPAGDHELTMSRLEEIWIEDQDGPGEVPSFALVRAVGCLTAGDEGDWRLERASAAVRADDPSVSNADALRALADEPPGAEVFSLGRVYPDPAAHAGQSVEVKGFLIRESTGNRINVSTVGMVAPRCQ